MSAAKHTPGPWAYDGQSRIDALQFRTPTTYTDDAGEEQTYMQGLVALPYGCGGLGTHEANARLIAAAPDLLNQLQRVYDSLGGETFDWEPVRAALAKAGGAS